MQQWQLAITATLPAMSTMMAGILRQDKLPGWINELISILVLVVTALCNTLFNGKLTGNVHADFLLVLAYIGTLMHQPLGLQIQQYLQSNVISFGKAAGSSFSEVEQLAALLLPGLAAELQKLGIGTPIVVQSGAHPIMETATPFSAATMTNTPLSDGVVSNNNTLPPQSQPAPSQSGTGAMVGQQITAPIGIVKP